MGSLGPLSDYGCQYLEFSLISYELCILSHFSIVIDLEGQSYKFVLRVLWSILQLLEVYF